MKRIVLILLLKFGLLKYLNLIFIINKIKIPILGGVGLENIEGTEKWMKEIFASLLKKTDGGFLDVGVNIGQTLIKVKSINSDTKYIGLEPNPACIFYVEKLIQINCFSNTKIIPSGISNANGVMTLNYYAKDLSDSSASVVKNFRPNQKVLKTQNIVVLTSELLKLDEKIAVVKIDVEGAELMVIEGIKEILDRDRPYIIIEILPVYEIGNIDRLGRQQKLLKIIQGLRYLIFKILKKPTDDFDAIEEIADIGIHSDITHCDYLFVPSEKSIQILRDFNNNVE